MLGYTDEKRQLDQALHTLEDKKETLIIELERNKARLHQFEEATQEIAAREDALERQQHTLEQSMGEEEQGRQAIWWLTFTLTGNLGSASCLD